MATGPGFGALLAVDILPEEEEVGAEYFGVREGFVSCAPFFRDLAAAAAAAAGVDAGFVEPDCSSDLFGEGSRELKGEERVLEVCAGR